MKSIAKYDIIQTNIYGPKLEFGKTLKNCVIKENKVEYNEKIKRWYTSSKGANGGNENLIDLLVVDVENKSFSVKINVSTSEKEERVINGIVVPTLYVSRFGFDFTISVLKRQGYSQVK